VHAPHFGKVLGPGQIATELFEHAAPRLDRRQLVGVADQDGLDLRLGGGGEEAA
jgi:hypothetical protein